MTFKKLALSRMKSGVINCKIAAITLFVVAYHAGEGYFVHPKLPGLKSVRVGCDEEGVTVAIKMYQQFVKELLADGQSKNQSCRLDHAIVKRMERSSGPSG
jgi:hypothetical protein